MNPSADKPDSQKRSNRRILISLAIVSTLVAVYFVGCTGKDHRKMFSELRGKINHRQDRATIKEQLLEFTPIGTDKAAVQSFLNQNFRRSAGMRLDSAPELKSNPTAASTVWVNLWVRYVFIFGQYETFAIYVFDENGELIDLIVNTADAFL